MLSLAEHTSRPFGPSKAFKRKDTTKKEYEKHKISKFVLVFLFRFL